MKTIPHCIAANEAKRETISLGHAAPSKASLGFRPAQSEQETGEIYYAGPHLLTVAPTGAGKGRSFLIPTLLTSPSQIIAVDVKGELYQTTHRRRREMGHQVIKLDPFRVMGPATDAFNPCECINLPNGDIGADCQTLASLLASGMKFSRDPFWDNSACGFVSGLLAYVTACEPVHQQTIPRLRDLLHQDDVVYSTAVLLDTKGKIMPRFAYQELASFLQHAERETRPSVLSTAAGYLKPFMSDRVADALGPSSFSLADFVQGEPMTIYLILPADRLESHKGLLRAWFGAFLRTIFSRTSPPRLQTLMLIDEAAQLGTFPMLQTAVTLARSYGVRCWMFFQDLQQILESFPQGWQTLVNNCAVNVFGVTNRMMAEQCANILSCHSEDLLKLGPNEQFVQLPGQDAIRARKHDYLRDRRYAGLFDDNRLYPAANPAPSAS